MLTKLDHTVLICRNIDQGIGAYSTLFGTSPSWVSRDEDAGIASAYFTCENTALEIIAPLSKDMTARFEVLLRDKIGKLTSLAFLTDSLEETHHTLSRRGLQPTEITSGESQDKTSGLQRTWQRFRCSDDVCAGIKTFILSREGSAAQPKNIDTSNIYGLDHVVINTPNPERAIAHYGTRLGLRFALDRTIEAFKTRFLFFRIGGVTLEVIHRLDKAEAVDTPDSLWGFTWSVKDLEAAHERLANAGLNISDIRTGRKPGTQVFTVRDGTLDIPTLFLAQSDRPS